MPKFGRRKYDVVVVGGGFYGCMIALFLAERRNKVLLVEKEGDLLTRASYNNQARVHNGYHYPRSFITALRSCVNYPRFIEDFKKAIVDGFLMSYAIAANSSKTTSRQFIRLCKQIDVPIEPAPSKLRNLFNENLIEDVFVVEEAIFNAAVLRRILKESLQRAKVKVLYEIEIESLSSSDDGILLYPKKGKALQGKRVFICTYSQINRILENSKLATLPFKHELTEMPLVAVPDEIKKIGITIMDGPFFGTLPFPDKRLHTLYHVRYTVHHSWFDRGRGGWPNIKRLSGRSNYLYIIKDAQRYMPILKDAEYKESLYEVRTILEKDEITDSRPILFRRNYGIRGLYVVMGGKIDNVYDIINEIKRFVI